MVVIYNTLRQVAISITEQTFGMFKQILQGPQTNSFSHRGDKESPDANNVFEIEIGNIDYDQFFIETFLMLTVTQTRWN